MTFLRALGILVVPCCAWLQIPAATPRPSGKAVELRRVPRGGIQPETVIDRTGVLHMLYFSGEPRAGNLFYVRSRDVGATFSEPVRVNSQDGSAIATGTIRGGQLALGRDGRVHVVWNGSDAALPRGPVHRQTGRPGMPLLYARSTPGGTAFEPQRNVVRGSWALDGGGSVAADGAGNIYVAWHAQPAEVASGDEGTRRVWVARSRDDGATFGAEGVASEEPTGACACCGVRVFSASTGKLFLLYRSATEMVNRDMHLLTSSDRAHSFAGARIHPWNIGACPMTSMSFAESNGRVLGAWETAGQVHFRALDGSGADAPPVAPDAVATGRKHPRLAAGGNGQVLLVWTEGTAWARGGSVAWQRFDGSGRPLEPIGSNPGVPVWSFATAVPHRGGHFVIFY
jgi:hypothetical protein